MLCVGVEQCVLERGAEKKLHVVHQPGDEGGCAVYVPALPGCINDGDTVDEAMRNIREAIEWCLEPVEEDFVVGEHSSVRKLAL